MDPLTRQVLSTTGGKKSTYVDDVFNTYLWRGNSTAGRSIDVGIDMAGEGGMAWIKRLTATVENHCLNDTARGAGKYLISNSNSGETNDPNRLTSFTDTGFTVGTDTATNDSGDDYAGWSFRKTPGFFDVVTWDGNSTGSRAIPHNLGSVPGCIMIKRTDANQDWTVYHRGIDISDNSTQRAPGDYGLTLNNTAARDTADYLFSDTEPTATHFTVGTGSQVNGNGMSYVAYVYAGGESTAATARGVQFSVSSDPSLSIADSEDFNLGSGDFTIECWAKLITANGQGQEAFINQWHSGQRSFFFGSSSSDFRFFWSTDGSNESHLSSGYTPPSDRQWHHYAVSRHGDNLRIFVDGIQKGTVDMSGATLHNSTGTVVMGCNGEITNGSRNYNGSLSNVRIVKGTAVYTESFKPPTEPLTNITNTKLLCCNNASVTGATVTPGTISVVQGTPVARTESPFDDIEGFVFGKGGDQNIIKCGGYYGNGNADGPHIECGWQPQWILTKRATGGTGNWQLYDSMRGIVSGGNDCVIHPDMSNVDNCGQDWIELTPTGFKTVSTSAVVNANTDGYVYVAIRSADGYVGKPALAGTGAFAMDTGNGSSTIPAFDSGFPVDLALLRLTASTSNWFTTPRIMGDNYLLTDANSAQGSTSPSFDKDSNVGWAQNSVYGTVYQSWMWKRGAGFDTVAYTGNGVDGRWIPHSLNAVPEMIWVKRRDTTGQWIVGHIGLDGGTAPWTHYLTLETADAEGDYPLFYDTAPTSTYFTVGGHAEVNGNTNKFITMLFSSVAGISKCGYYTGTGSDHTITVGFEPRLVIIKKINSASNSDWVLFDSLRGIGSGNDPILELNQSAAQDNFDVMDKTSTAFTILGSFAKGNASGDKYIYYAHA